jgi:hypothetical protein
LAAVALRDYVATLRPAVNAAPAAAANTGSAPAERREVAEPDIAQWQPEQQREVATLAARIVNDSSWKRHVVAALSDDRTDLDQAEAAAQKLGIRTFDLHLRRLARRSVNARRWDLVFAAAEPVDLERLIDVAQSTFAGRFADPRTHHSSVATALNTDELRAGAALEAVLRGVARYPGSGMNLVESSLADTDDRVRRAAVETLVRWGGPYLRNVSVRSALNSAANDESDEALKARMVALLNLGTLP